MTGQATATPQGAQVVNGNVVISQNGQYMIIQASDGSIINFSSFNIWNGQTVQFIQPGEFARVLNRITGPDPSMINGTLLANGTVYISNPAGIYFGHGALVDVGGIYAAAGTITDNKFLNHIDRFREVTGSVVNHGEIRASHAAHLIGQYVKNTGIVRADQGVITMIAGNDILISEVGGHVHVKVDGHQLLHNGPLAGSSTPTIIGQAGVENTGSVIADGGQIILGAGDMYGLALRNSGLLRASGGEIHLAAADGAIHNTVDGTIKVSVDNGLAGDITIHAPSIVNQGRIRADADFGHAGTIEITSQNHTHLIDGSTITAQGRGNAKGGDILIHSYNGVTYVSSNSTIDFSGGASGGAGGFAEVSGKELGLHGTIRMAGGGGAADGELLIDPIGIKVWNYTPGVGDPDPGLGDNEVLFNDFPNTVLSIAYSSLADLVGTITLQAEQTIIFGNSVAGDTLAFTNAPDLVLEAGKHINFKGSIVGLGSLTASADVAFTGLPSDGIGSIRLFEDWAGSTLEATGAVEFNSPQRIQIFRNITADTIALNSDVFVGGPITLTAATSITTSSGINTQGGVVPNALVLNAPDVEVAGSIGDVNALGSLEVSGTTFAFGGDGIVTEGGQTYATNVELAQDTTFTSQGSADITFDGTLAAQAGFDDADVQVNTGGTTTFNGDVTLASLETDAGGTAEFGGGVAVTTTGDQTYNDTVDAGEAANFATFTSSGGSISFLSDATVRGHVDADQDVLFDGLATVSGNVMAGNDATFNGDATFDGDASQTVSAGGAVQFNAAASKTVGDAGNGLTVEGDSITFAEGVDSQGFLTVNGDYTVAGDVAAEFDIDLNGSGTFNGDDVNQAITSTNGSIETGDLDKTGEGNLTVEVLDNTQTILVDGTIDVADGSLNVLNNGGTLEVTGDVNTSDASTFDGVSTIGGDITSSQVTFTDDAFFGSNEEGGGLTQVVTATSGIIDAQGNVTASNGLTFNANGNVQVAGDVDVQNGTFTVASTNGDAMMGGDITASDDIIFDDTDLVLTEEGDQTITAGNDIAFGGDVTKADGSLAIIADNTVADGRIDILDGDLTVDSDLTLNHNAGNNGFSVRTSGTQTYNGLLTLGANTRLRTTGAGGDIMITSGVAGAGRNLDVDAAGLATLLGDIAVADLDVAGGGGIDLDAIIDASGSVDFADQVNLLGNSTIEGQSVRFRDAVGGNARLLIRNADLIRLDGDVTVDDLRLKNSGTAIIKGVVTTTGDVLITNVDVVTLDEVNAGARLRVTGGSSATFNGDLDADSIVADATDGLLFEGSRSVTANGNIDLNRLGRDTPADVATVASTGDLTVTSANGNVRFGRNEKVTALGDLDISGTLVELSDLNALGSINVNASTIRLLARAAGNVKLAAIQGGGVDVDTGIDFVAGNSIIFSVAPTLVGGPAGATARFSTSTGGDVTFAGSTAIPFVVLQFTDAANAAAYASGGTIFDLLAGGISNANVSDALAGAVPQDDETREVEQSIGLDPGTRQVLQLLGINAVAPNNADLRNAAADGVMVQDDAPRVMASDDLTLRVSETRIPAVQANAIRDDYNRVFAAETGDGADGTVTGEQLIKTRLAEGYDAYFERLDETGDEASPAGFTAFLRETDPDLYGRLEAVNRMLGAIDELPLSTYEYDQARRKLVTQRLLPPVLGQRYDFFSDALDTVGR